MNYIRTKNGVEKMTDVQYQEYILSKQEQQEAKETVSTETTNKTGE